MTEERSPEAEWEANQDLYAKSRGRALLAAVLAFVVTLAATAGGLYLVTLYVASAHMSEYNPLREVRAALVNCCGPFLVLAIPFFVASAVYRSRRG